MAVVIVLGYVLREEHFQLETRRFYSAAQFVGSVLADVWNLRLRTRPRARIYRENLGVIASFEQRRDAGDGCQIGRGNQHPAALLEHPANLEQHEHGIAQQVFDQLTNQHNFEIIIRIGKFVALGIEMIDIALEFSSCRKDAFMVNTSWNSKISTANFLITAEEMQSRCDLHIASQFQRATRHG